MCRRRPGKKGLCKLRSKKITKIFYDDTKWNLRSFTYISPELLQPNCHIFMRCQMRVVGIGILVQRLPTRMPFSMGLSGGSRLDHQHWTCKLKSKKLQKQFYDHLQGSSQPSMTPSMTMNPKLSTPTASPRVSFLFLLDFQFNLLHSFCQDLLYD